MDKSGEEVYKMLNYPNEDVRQAAVGAMAQFVISLSKSSAPEAAEGKSYFFYQNHKPQSIATS